MTKDPDSRYDLHVTTLCDRCISIYYCAVHRAIYHDSYPFSIERTIGLQRSLPLA